MTTETIEAVYEHGGFRPIAPLDIDLAEGQKVRILVERLEWAEDVLSLAAQVYKGLEQDEIEVIERHGQRRKAFFGERTFE